MNAITPHPIPDAALESDIAILGRKGSGKSLSARRLAERLLDAGRRVVVLDPLGQWYGLKARADGTPGYPVTVIGGDHADVALDPATGAALGAFVAKASGCYVLDVSDLRRPEMITFLGAFLAALYTFNRDPIWLIADEADYFAPEGGTREQRVLAYELDQIARRGRAKGFRLWTITQRAAKLDKSLLSQAASLLVLKLIAPQDRRAVEDWLGGNVENGGEVADQLPQLARGQAYFWNPDLAIARKLSLPIAKTLDTGFTPSADAAPISATLAKPDVGALRKALGVRAAPLSPDAIRAEAYAQGRAAGAREERARLRAILGDALTALGEPEKSAQDAPDADLAATLAAESAKAAPGPPAGPRSNDEAQRAILSGLNAPQRRMVERLLERGEMSPLLLADRVNAGKANKAFADNLGALEQMGLLERGVGYVRAGDRLYPLGRDHR